MWKLWKAAVSAAIALAAAGCAPPEDPKAVIEKAIEAHGGREKLAKRQAVHTKAKGTLILGGADLPFVMETDWQWPDQIKDTVEFQVPDKKTSVSQTFDGDNGWVDAGGTTAPLAGKKLDELKAQVHLRRLLVLTPLLSDKAYELTALKEIDVNGRPASGVQVVAEGQRDVRLYFDKHTGLLAKIQRQVLDEALMKQVAQEDFPSDYRDVDGLPTAMKELWHRSGRKVLEMEFTEVKYPEKIEARTFVQPTRAASVPAIDSESFTRSQDVIYGRKYGTALTMDVFTPKLGANGAAVVLVMSGGWVSDSQTLNTTIVSLFIGEPLKRGYTVFAVFHGSQPKFTIPEAIADVNRAVRYIRSHAQDYRIDPDRIGITGGSAGGHLSLMQGTAGDGGDPKASDPIDRVSSRVQAVACLFPPTDFLNYGMTGQYAFGPSGPLAMLRAAADVREFNPKTQRLERPTDEEQVHEIVRKISPVMHVTEDDPPTLIIHGDADTLVPIQQSELIMARFKKVGVSAELIVRRKRGHDFSGGDKDLVAIVDWFDKHLAKK